LFFIRGAAQAMILSFEDTADHQASIRRRSACPYRYGAKEPIQAGKDPHN
jgi:hypothetical protein